MFPGSGAAAAAAAPAPADVLHCVEENMRECETVLKVLKVLQ